MKDEVEFDFPERGMLLVKATNKDTGGSSGGGKSTFLMALNTALGCCPLPMTELQSWGVDEPVSVTLGLDTDRGPVSVTRGAKASSLKIGSDKPLTSAKSIREKMDEILGVSPEILLALTYSPQQDQTDFLSLTNSEKQEFLSALLPFLGKLEKAAEDAQVRLSHLKSDETAAFTTVQIQEKHFSAASEALNAVGVEEDPALMREAVECAEAALHEAGTEVATHSLAYDTQHEERKGALERVRAEYDGPEQAALEALSVVMQALKQVEASRPAPVQEDDALRDACATHAQTQKRLDELAQARPATVADTPALERLKNHVKIGTAKLQEVRAQDMQMEADFRRRCQALDTRIANIVALQRAAPKLKQDLARIEQEILTLEGSVCPTCDQQWLDAKQKIVEKRADAALIEQQIEGLRNDDLALDGLRAEREALKFIPNPLIAQVQGAIENLNIQIAEERALIQALNQKALHEHEMAVQSARAERDAAAAKVKAEMQRLSEAANLLNAEHSARVADARARVADSRRAVTEVEHQRGFACDRVNQEYANKLLAVSGALDRAKTNRNRAELQLHHAKEEVRRVEMQNQFIRKSRDAAEKTLASAHLALESAEAKLVALREDMAAEQDFIRLVGREGFMGSIFDEVLAEISQETNNILGRVANTAHMTLEFRSEVTSKDGKVRKEIKPVVTIGGHESSLKAGCSGGMYSAVRLAVRIAVRRVISRRTGSFPCWLCLDESFDGLDTPSKEACMEVLSEAAQEDLILVVDHSTEFKALFSQTINLEFAGGVTTLAN